MGGKCSHSCLVFTVVLFCLVHVMEASNNRLLSRSKRGFRLNSASRVAHGYGKRAFDRRSNSVEEKYAAVDPSDNLNWSIMNVDELSSLLTSNNKLATALVKTFIDSDGDNVITAQELFRNSPRK